MSGDFRDAIDHSLAEALLPLLSSEVVINGKGLREVLLGIDPVVRTTTLPAFFALVEDVLSPPDAFGRARQFL